jgi:hypothetical protein
MVLPSWLAWTVHVPDLSNVMLDPVAVQTDGVVVVKLTVSPDDDVALTLTGDWTIVLLASDPKLMVCALTTSIELCTVAAAAYLELPTWLASTTQVPGAV